MQEIKYVGGDWKANPFWPIKFWEIKQNQTKGETQNGSEMSKHN